MLTFVIGEYKIISMKVNKKAGFPRGNIKYLVDNGKIEKSARGVYILPQYGMMRFIICKTDLKMDDVGELILQSFIGRYNDCRTKDLETLKQSFFQYLPEEYKNIVLSKDVHESKDNISIVPYYEFIKELDICGI